MNLSVINYPNLASLSCDVDTLTIPLGGRRVTGGLPNMVNYNLRALEGSPCDTITAINEIKLEGEIQIYPNPASAFIEIKTNTAETYFYTLQNILGEEIESGMINKNKTKYTLINLLK